MTKTEPAAIHAMAAEVRLASSARRRIQAQESKTGTNLSEQRKVVDAFLTALRSGGFEGLVAVLLT